MRAIPATPAAKTTGALPVTHLAPVIPPLRAMKARAAVARLRVLSRDGLQVLLTIVPGTLVIVAAMRPTIAAETRPPIEVETPPEITVGITPATRAGTPRTIAGETHPTIPEIEVETPAIGAETLPAIGAAITPAIVEA
ncbi:MAG TPA: hypothetical protein VK198_18060 [Terriglobales bacterium]|nr:hypothetical protein [Terriglobales bacterium]